MQETGNQQQSTLFGGGRYDGLAEALGGPRVPGVGFGMGLERVLLALADEGLAPPAEEPLAVFVVALGDEARSAGTTLVSDLRRAGVSADAAYEERPLKAQLKMADRGDARFAAIIGSRRAGGGHRLAPPARGRFAGDRRAGGGRPAPRGGQRGPMSDRSTYATAMRTHACGELRAEHAGADVTLCGWVARRRDHGGVTFIDLRDREGAVQVVFHPEEAAEAHATAQDLRAEWVVRVTGTVRERPEGMRNPALATGDVEIVATELAIVSRSETPPFLIEDRVEAEELLRLEYRYLDLRRPEMTRALRLRHHVTRLMHEHLDALGFVDVETPLLGRATPEGARDFLVPARVRPGTFFALPQSPQQLKQLLMVGGQDRYYQIVRCLRDEATRADRGFEFTQLDIEMAFVDEEDIFAVIEPLYARIIAETQGVEVADPVPTDGVRRDGRPLRVGQGGPPLRDGTGQPG